MFPRWGLYGCVTKVSEARLDLPDCEASEISGWLTAKAGELFASGHSRVEVRVSAGDRSRISALHHARFRREARLRGAGADGEDLLVYSLVRDDVVTGAMGFTAMLDTVLPTHRVIGHVLLTDQTGRVLLLETTYKPDWELPGGVVEPGESPRVGAQRELMEELGLEIALGQPLLVDWMPPYLGWSDAIEFIFDGGICDAQMTEAMVLPCHEIAAFHWVEPDRVAAHVSKLSARRIARMLQMLIVNESMTYTENGLDPQAR